MARMYSSTKQAFPNERYYAIECFTPKRRFPIVRIVIVASLLALLMWLTPSAKANDWSDTDKALAISAVALHVIDWRQTTSISASNGAYVEKAPITRAVLGSTPERSHVDLYMLLTGALILGAAHLFPEYRTYILGAWASTRLAVVVNNHAIGLRINF